MKNLILTFMALMTIGMTAVAQPKIKFEKTTHNYGKFKKSDGPQKCSFTFTNVGDKDLIIHRAIATCGCTAPTFTKTPIKPGETGVINVEYTATRIQMGGHFKKSITVNCNGKPEMVRLYIEGDMEDNTEE